MIVNTPVVTELEVKDGALHCHCGRLIRGYDLRPDIHGGEIICSACHTTVATIRVGLTAGGSD
jgi:hypothetical protein